MTTDLNEIDHRMFTILDFNGGEWTHTSQSPYSAQYIGFTWMSNTIDKTLCAHSRPTEKVSYFPFEYLGYKLKFILD